MIHLVVRDENIELSPYLFSKLLKLFPSSDLNAFLIDKQQPIYINIDPCIFYAYLLYIETGCLIRPDYVTQNELINGLRIGGVSLNLVNHYEFNNLISSLSSRNCLYSLIHHKDSNRQKWISSLILSVFFIAGCCLTIDLYRQILILNENPYRETSKLFIIIIYLVDGILFLYSFSHGISRFIINTNKRKKLGKDPYFITDTISCFGVLCYFIIQRPITNVHLSYYNALWIFIHTCRTIRIVQLGYRLIYIQWCLYAVTQCFWIFLPILTGIFWILILSGSMLCTIDMIENNQQYSNNRLTIFSTYETLYAIGYRNNPPFGFLTRLWTLINIYFISSIMHTLLWSFQSTVAIRWKILLNEPSEKLYEKSK